MHLRVVVKRPPVKRPSAARLIPGTFPAPADGATRCQSRTGLPPNASRPALPRGPGTREAFGVRWLATAFAPAATRGQRILPARPHPLGHKDVRPLFLARCRQKAPASWTHSKRFATTRRLRTSVRLWSAPAPAALFVLSQRLTTRNCAPRVLREGCAVRKLLCLEIVADIGQPQGINAAWLRAGMFRTFPGSSAASANP